MKKLSLFSGILGDDLASEWAGIETICCVEINPFCQAVIKKHKLNMPIIGDIKDVTRKSVKELTGYDTVDIIGGGFPCQPFSQAGKQRGEEDNRYLWSEMLRVISEFRPTWVVAENVAGLLRMGITDCLSQMESCGYETTSFLIPSGAVNTLHRRYRVFLVAHSASDGRAQYERDVESGDDFNACCERRRVSQPTVSRAIYGIPSKLDKARIKSLGNSVVPQQIYPIYRAIVEIESDIEL